MIPAQNPQIYPGKQTWRRQRLPHKRTWRRQRLPHERTRRRQRLPHNQTQRESRSNEHRNTNNPEDPSFDLTTEYLLKSCTFHFDGQMKHLEESIPSIRSELLDENIYDYYFAKSAIGYLSPLTGKMVSGLEPCVDKDVLKLLESPAKIKTKGGFIKPHTGGSAKPEDVDLPASMGILDEGDPIDGSTQIQSVLKKENKVEQLKWFKHILSKLGNNQKQSEYLCLKFVDVFVWGVDYYFDDAERKIKKIKLTSQGNKSMNFCLRNDTSSTSVQYKSNVPVYNFFVTAVSNMTVGNFLKGVGHEFRRIKITHNEYHSKDKLLFREESLQELVAFAIILKVIRGLENGDFINLLRDFELKGETELTSERENYIEEFDDFKREYHKYFSKEAVEDIRTDLLYLTIAKDGENYTRIIGTNAFFDDHGKIKEYIMKIMNKMGLLRKLKPQRIHKDSTNEIMKPQLCYVDSYYETETVDFQEADAFKRNNVGTLLAVPGPKKVLTVSRNVRNALNLMPDNVAILSCLLSDITYLNDDVITTLFMKNDVTYLKAYEPDIIWKDFPKKHRVHVWYQRYTLRGTKYRLFIAHRGSLTSEDFQDHDYSIMKGIATYYDELILRLQPLIHKIQDDFLERIFDTIGTSTTIEVDLYTTGHSLGGFMALMTSYYSLGALAYKTNSKTGNSDDGQKVIKLDYRGGFILPITFNAYVGNHPNIINCLNLLPKASTAYRVNQDIASINLDWSRKKKNLNMTVCNIKSMNDMISYSESAFFHRLRDHILPLTHSLYNFIGRAHFWICAREYKIKQYLKYDFSNLVYNPLEGAQPEQDTWYMRYFFDYNATEAAALPLLPVSPPDNAESNASEI